MPSGLVAQTPLAPFTTPVDGDDLAAAVVVSHDNTTASAHTTHDADGTIHFQSSTLAARPAAGTPQRKWITTDGLRVYLDFGGVWNEIAYLSTAGGTVTGATTFSALITANAGVTVTGAITATGNITTTGGVLVAASEVDIGTAILAQAASPNAIVAGSATGDLVIRTASKAILFTIDGGTTIAARVTNAGVFTTGSGSGSGGITQGSIDLQRDIFMAATQGIVVGAGRVIDFSTTDIRTTGVRLLIGHTVTTGSAAGDVVLANGKVYRTVNNAGTTSVRLIELTGASDNILVDGSGKGAQFGAGAVFAGAVSGITTLAGSGAISGFTTLTLSSTLIGATRIESGHFKGNTAAPSASIGAALGSGGAVAVTLTGNDAAGTILLVAGTAGLGAGVATTVTFNVPYTTSPYVLLTYDASSGVSTYVGMGPTAVGTASFAISLFTAPTAGQQYRFYYAVIQ